MNRSPKALLLTVLSSLAFASGQVPTPSDAAFSRGVTQQQQGNWRAAQADYEEALRSLPRRVDALTNLGVVLSRQGDYARAINSYRKALRVAPTMVAVRLNLGIALYQTRDYADAVRELRLVENQEPDNHQARALRGIALKELGRLLEAIRELEIARRQEPQDRATSYALANAYIASGETEKAEALSREVFASVDSAEAHLIFGGLHAAAGRHREAIEELTEAAKLNSGLPTLHSMLGTEYLKMGDVDSARQQFRMELKTNPLDFNSNLRLGRILREDASLQESGLRPGTLQEAAELLHQARQLRPTNVDALYETALLRSAQGDRNEAVVLLEELVRQAPKFVPGHVLLASLYRKQNRLREASREQVRIGELSGLEPGSSTSSDKRKQP